MYKRYVFLICCILVLGLVASASSKNLLAWYKLDETSGLVAADATGNGYDGTIEGLENWVEGTTDGAYEFWGSDYIVLPAETMGMTSFIGSVAFWMNMTESSSINTIWWGGDNTTGGGFGPENEMHMHAETAVGNVWEGGEFCFYLRCDPNPNVHLHSDPEKSGADDPGAEPVNPVLVNDEVWHHIAGVWDGNAGTATLYIDGIPLMEWPFQPTVYDLSHMFLGTMGGISRQYTGKLDDVRIYSDALTAAEVYMLYEKDTDVSDGPAAKPQGYLLNQNYPNPFNPETSIEFVLENSGHTTLEIYNKTGQLVETLIDGQLGSGFHQVSFRAENYPSGIYFYMLKSDNFKEMKKMMLLK